MKLRIRQKLDKYRISGRLGTGGFAEVFKARDTVEGIDVALKVPHPGTLTPEAMASFRQEVRMAAALDHPNILPIKTAGFLDGLFVVVTPLGRETLADRLRRRLSRKTVLEFGQQLLEALAYAHRRKIAHCDLKPENLIVFPDNRLRLSDFGIAKVALRTLTATGSGTLGYIAPEQAMGKPSLRSDVFAAGLILYRMMSGRLPEWPFKWPFPDLGEVRRKYSADLIEVVRRACAVDAAKRYSDAGQMLRSFKRVRARAVKRQARKKVVIKDERGDWRAVRIRQFVRRHGRTLATRHTCPACRGPMSEPMTSCPWCGKERRVFREETRFPARCPRCRRGVKLDWRFCAWCYGSTIGPCSERTYTDKRYERRCGTASCERRELIPFSKYCCWCRRKVTHRWKIAQAKETCSACGWGVVDEFWSFCPWCGRKLKRN